MLRKHQTLLPPKLHSDLHTMILPNLSFKNLTELVEDRTIQPDLRTKAEGTLKKKHPAYVNLKKAWLNRDFVTLIDSLAMRILPLLDDPKKIRIYPKTESTYRRLLSDHGSFIGYLIGSQLFSNSVHNDLDPLFIHDLVFHYCRFSPRAAGELLNKNILKLWSSGNRYLVSYLIIYGANVNAVWRDSQSTLFHAVTSHASAELIRHLIDHGATYTGYGETRHGVRYTLLLLAALDKNQEALPVLMEKFPDEVTATLETLAEMLRRDSDREFSCEHGAYKPYSAEGQPLRPFYSLKEIRLAKELILQLIRENTKTMAGAQTATVLPSSSMSSSASSSAAAAAPTPPPPGSAHPAGIFSPRAASVTRILASQAAEAPTSTIGMDLS